MSKNEVVVKKDITITVGMNEDNIPVKMEWKADDSGKEPLECKAMLLSLFEKETMDTLRIDLWTKEMQVQEMDRFVFQTLRGLGETYMRATNNKELANEMQSFVTYFGEKTEIIPKGK